MTSLLRFHDPDNGARWGVRVEDTVYDITSEIGSLAAWLRGSAGRVRLAIDALDSAAQDSVNRYAFTDLLNPPDVNVLHLLPPLDEQDVWAAGVTYERSRSARQEEAIDGGDIYARVYNAERPEIFFKARGSWVVGHLAEVGIRRDAHWNVPEPELTVIINPALEVVGVTVGNDMCSRDIEGANPLYLPQAKMYTASCALGPQVLLGHFEAWHDAEIRVVIERDGQRVVDDTTHTRHIHRRLDELVSYLGHSFEFPDGVLFMTGTGIIPASDFSLQVGDTVHITIDGIGTLTNIVKLV